MQQRRRRDGRLTCPFADARQRGVGVEMNEKDVERGGRSPSSDAIPRENGGEEGMEVCFRGVSCSYSGRTKDEQTVLHECSGGFLPGNVSAIIGPSGAGKTSLLDILAGRKTVGNICGEVLYDGKRASEVPELGRLLSYVPQDDSFIPMMTVREALMFAAQLKGSNMSQEQQKDKVESALYSTGLGGISDHNIGGVNFSGFYIRGISGGERRRLSLGLSLVASPSILFLDEFTTGLDSFNALHIMTILRREAKERKVTVVTTIHQPQQRIWDMLDTVLVFSCGQMLYAGSPRKACNWFEAMGYKPKMDVNGFNVCDFILEVVSISPWKQQEKDVGNTMLSFADLQDGKEYFLRNCDSINQIYHEKIPYNPVDPPIPSGFLVQLCVLTKRSAIKYYRDFFIVIGRMVCTVLIAVLIGLAFMDTRNSPIQQLNILFIMTVVTLVIPFVAISTFVSDRQFFIKESKSRMYGALAYYVANTVCEGAVVFVSSLLLVVPTYFWLGFRTGAKPFFKAFLALWLNHWNSASTMILSSLALPNISLAMVASGGMVMINVIFSNHVVPLSMVSKSVSWIQYLCTSRYAFEALVVNQFDTDTIYVDVDIPGIDESAAIFNACTEALNANSELASLISIPPEADLEGLGLQFSAADILSNGGFDWSYVANIAGLLVINALLQFFSYAALRVFSRESR